MGRYTAHSTITHSLPTLSRPHTNSHTHTYIHSIQPHSARTDMHSTLENSAHLIAQNRVEQSRAEQNRIEQNRIDSVEWIEWIEGIDKQTAKGIQNTYILRTSIIHNFYDTLSHLIITFFVKNFTISNNNKSVVLIQLNLLLTLVFIIAEWTIHRVHSIE